MRSLISTVVLLITSVTLVWGDAIPDSSTATGLRWVSPWELRDSLRGVPLPTYIDSLENFERFIFGERWRAEQFGYQQPKDSVTVDTLGVLSGRTVIDLAIHISFDEYDVIDYLLFETDPNVYRLIDRRQVLTRLEGPVRHRLVEIDGCTCIEWWHELAGLELSSLAYWICDTTDGDLRMTNVISMLGDLARNQVNDSGDYIVAFADIQGYDHDSLVFNMTVDSSQMAEGACFPIYHRIGRVRIRLGIEQSRLVAREVEFIGHDH